MSFINPEQKFVVFGSSGMVGSSISRILVRNGYTKILNPRETWEDREGYDLQAQKLVKMFSDNFDVFKPYVDIDIIDAAPNLQAAE